MDFDHECKRKGDLLDLFWDLQEGERKEMARANRKSLHIKYDRMFRGMVVIDSITPQSIRLIRENGKVIEALQINPKIAGLLREEDHLFLVAGRRDKLWRTISLEGIATRYEAEPGKNPVFHMSGMNPLKGLLTAESH